MIRKAFHRSGYDLFLQSRNKIVRNLRCHYLAVLKKYAIIIICCIVLGSCKKESADCKCVMPPGSLNFELVNTDGKTLLKSLKDTVTISYIDNGVKKVEMLSVEKLLPRNPANPPANNFNGLVINDNKVIYWLSYRETNPVYNFTIYLNGVAKGEIFIKLREANSDSSDNFKFNNVPVRHEGTYEWLLKDTDIALLQTQ